MHYQKALFEGYNVTKSITKFLLTESERIEEDNKQNLPNQLKAKKKTYWRKKVLSRFDSI
jgi:hypothetical protein